ncbi:MAG TPA: TauD/TfdA family dioxygenase [Methylomirabilota bacterium]|nr:TauD/TfdA family dioxygenase [Methylomirabilota bacterium]
MTATAIDRPITGPMVWHGRDLAASTDWIRPFRPAALEEIDAALRAVQRRGLEWREIGKRDFPLPGVSAELAQANRDLEWGRGLVLLRGLPVERYSDDELRAIWWGLGRHLGTAVHQNAHGELIGEVRDEVRLYGEVVQPAVPRSEGVTSRAKARSSGPLRWHTDRCDVVGLLCVRVARHGGASRIVSVPAVSNAILERRPDLHARLCADYWRSRQGEEAGGEASCYAMPVFAMHEGKFTTQYSRTFVEAAQKIAAVPRLTPAQDEALDLLAAVCDELSYEMELRPGDIQLLNNHVIYHGRAAYEDDPGPGRDRLLMRLWLAPPNSRPLPEGFEVLWGSIKGGAVRGGIAQPAPTRG